MRIVYGTYFYLNIIKIGQLGITDNVGTSSKGFGKNYTLNIVRCLENIWEYKNLPYTALETILKINKIGHFLFLELKCFDFPHHDSVPESIASFSPMAEFIPHSYDEQTKEQKRGGNLVAKPISYMKDLQIESKENTKMDKIVHYEHVVDELFSSFSDSFQKNYKSTNEHEKRKDIFRHNMR